MGEGPKFSPLKPSYLPICQSLAYATVQNFIQLRLLCDMIAHFSLRSIL